MKRAGRTYYKALFLAAVFSMNTVVSFACSFSNLFHGIHHHQPPASPEEQEHSGNHHAGAHEDKHEHTNGSEHKHERGAANESKDDCCSGPVVELQKIEKAASRSIEAPPTVLIAPLFTAFYSFFQLDSPEDDPRPRYIRWRPPPTIPDLRIVIQSFQI